jgi:hypothetical protein
LPVTPDSVRNHYLRPFAKVYLALAALDQPPHCGLLFAGTHELEAIFTRQATERSMPSRMGSPN